MKTLILGGGVTGLSAAYKLGEVLVLEKEKEIGGLLASYFVDGFSIEKYYHHFFVGDKALLSLLRELELENTILWLKAKTGYFIEGKIFSLNTPVEILKFTPLSFFDKTRLAFFTLRSRFERKEKLDEVLATDWILKNCGKRVFEKFFLPLLQAKFGRGFEKISAAWLASRIALRSNRGWSGEKLGYLKGGFQVFLDRLCRKIEGRGGKIRTSFEVTKILVEKNKIKGVVGKDASRKEEFIPCKKIISTLSPLALRKVLGENFQKLNINVKFQGVCCVLLSLKEPLLKDIYWLNIGEKLPFGAIIEHTNFLSPKNYENQHLVYFASYFQDENNLLAFLEGENLLKFYIEEIKKLFPDFKKENINWWKISKNREAGPVYEIGYNKLIPPHTTPIKGLYIAGTFSKENYPERSLEGAILTGLEIVKILRQKNS